jgi:hypothetical protein
MVNIHTKILRCSGAFIFLPFRKETGQKKIAQDNDFNQLPQDRFRQQRVVMKTAMKLRIL